MTNLTYALLQLGVMALVTYLVRMLPMTLFTQKTKAVFCALFSITFRTRCWER